MEDLPEGFKLPDSNRLYPELFELHREIHEFSESETDVFQRANGSQQFFGTAALLRQIRTARDEITISIFSDADTARNDETIHCASPHSTRINGPRVTSRGLGRRLQLPSNERASSRPSHSGR